MSADGGLRDPDRLALVADRGLRLAVLVLGDRHLGSLHRLRLPRLPGRQSGEGEEQGGHEHGDERCAETARTCHRSAPRRSLSCLILLIDDSRAGFLRSAPRRRAQPHSRPATVTAGSSQSQSSPAWKQKAVYAPAAAGFGGPRRAATSGGASASTTSARPTR